MKTSIYATLLANLVLATTFAPAAFPQPFDNRHDNRRDNRPSNWHDNRPSNWHDNRPGNRHDYRHDNFPQRDGRFTYRQQRVYPNQNNNYDFNRRRVAANNRWNWNQHNWNDQRSYLRDNWRQRNGRLSARQQQQLDARMRAQWLRYHNNNWNGQYTWDQYSDPQFLDYIHNNDPSLMSTIRSSFGF